MAKVTAQQYAEKWQRRMKGAQTDITNGVNRVSEAPGVRAAAKADKMLTGITNAITSGVWAERVASVPLQTWKDQTITKGIPRIAAGVDGAMAKQVVMAGRLLDAVDNVKAQIEGMSDTTFEDRINRMVAFSRGMSEQTIK
tara:strand:- start:229 stop:651 length:423 start_codon:yes stop_codon:yes gene_type:complete